MEMPKTILRHLLEALVGILELEEVRLYLGVQVQQPEIGGDGGAGNAAAPGQIHLGVGLTGVQRLLRLAALFLLTTPSIASLLASKVANFIAIGLERLTWQGSDRKA